MKTIVFVCTGNTCRSPMAEGMFRILLQQNGIADVEVTSCGTSAFPGMTATFYAIQAAAEHGADIKNHRARALTDEILQNGDLFVCMTESHRAMLQSYLPAEKLRVMSPAVSDPFNGDLDRYRKCADEISRGLESLIKEI